jgi:hypothetical protein
MLDLETRLKVFFASAPQNIRSIQTLEISHPQMTPIYYLWREPYVGQTRINGTTMVDMIPQNFEIKLAGSSNDLDQKFEIRISTVDIENEFRNALDSIPINTTNKVTVIYREYLSDDLLTEQAKATLQAESISYAIGIANIVAVSPRLNISRTGELYNTRDIPTLRGFL